MPWTNEDVARQFASIAALLRLSGADTFRVRAYERAATAIATAPADIGTLNAEELAQLPGVGASTAAKITEYLQTGAIAMLEDLRAKVPPGMLELTRVPGLGPKGAKTLYDRLGVDSIEALRAAIETQKLRDLPGFGLKTEAKLREALDHIGAKDLTRRPMADGIALAEELCERIAKMPTVEQVAFAGSMRRGRDTIGDIDLVVASRDPGPVHAALRDSYLVADVLAAGDAKTSVRAHIGLQIDLRVVEPQSFGAALVYFTGSKEHNVRIRERAVRRGLLVNEYGVFRKGDNLGEGAGDSLGEHVAGATEADVYAALGLDFIPPTLREDSGEVAAAEQHRLPTVVTLGHIRGDLHGHSDWSGDGKHTLDAMLTAAQGRGLEYWAVTDHAENLTINGLTRQRMLERRAVLADAQERYDIRILEGAELNIDGVGSVDYDPAFLSEFDWCVASIHSEMRRPGAEQTKRILAAMQHPSVHAIGHLTGRILGRRDPYDVELDAVLDAARETGTALEINASPRRLDLNAEMVRRAVDAGVTLTISTDAHSIGDLGSMRYGVWTAQRGWATAAAVLNTRDVDAVLAFARAKRERFS